MVVRTLDVGPVLPEIVVRQPRPRQMILGLPRDW
jgi:hypothetical protein